MSPVDFLEIIVGHGHGPLKMSISSGAYPGLRLWSFENDLCENRNCIMMAGCEFMMATYRDSGNTIQFSFFTIVFSPPIQKITIPKCKFYFSELEKKTKLFLAVTIKIDFSMRIIFLWYSFHSSRYNFSHLPRKSWHQNVSFREPRKKNKTLSCCYR